MYGIMYFRYGWCVKFNWKSVIRCGLRKSKRFREKDVWVIVYFRWFFRIIWLGEKFRIIGWYYENDFRYE